MNERIKELAKQAGFAMKIDDDPNSPPGWWGAGHDPTFEKFAELIVKECIDICENSSIPFDISVWLNSTKKEMTALTALALSGLIKERFGVE